MERRATDQVVLRVFGQVEAHVMGWQLHEGVGPGGPGHLQICRWQPCQSAGSVMQAGKEQAHALGHPPLLEAQLGCLDATQMWYLHAEKEHASTSTLGHPSF